MEENNGKSSKNLLRNILLIILLIAAFVVLAPIALTVLLFIMMMFVFSCDSPKSTSPWCPKSMISIENSVVAKYENPSLKFIAPNKTES